MIRTGVIGVSGYGNTYYEMLMRLHAEGAIRFAAAAVINQETEQEKCAAMRSAGTRLYADYREMLAVEKLDLCCIPTGIALHEPMACAAMRSGAHVLLEKPAAATVQEIERMEKTEKETGKTVSIGFQDIYRPEFQELKRKLLDGLIGEIREVSIFAISPADDAYYTRNNWAGRLQSEGRWVLDSPFNNSNAHSINLALFLCGKSFRTAARPLEVEAELYRVSPLVEAADTGTIRVRTDGPEFFIAMTRASLEREIPDIRMIGSHGALTIKRDFITMPSGEEIAADSNFLHIRTRLFDTVFRRMAGDREILSADLAMARMHALCVNGAHASSEVWAVSGRHVGKITENGKTYHVMHGLREYLLLALKRKEMLSRIAPLVFTGKGMNVSLTDFKAFLPVKRKSAVA